MGWASLRVLLNVLALSLCLPGQLFAGLPGAADARNPLPEWKLQTQETFKLGLHKRLKTAHRNSLGYDQARKALLGNLHLQKGAQGYFIHDVYCQRDYTAADFKEGKGPGPGLVPGDSVLNTEHTWPQSRFSRLEHREVQKADLHHLFPADSEVNSNRGNFKFGEVRFPLRDIKCTESRMDQQSNQNTHFEPPAVHKGNVARALFYFSIRYRISIDPDEEMALRKWHREDPADGFERQRNEEIEKLQGNRNPFIDDPDLADQIGDF